MTAAKRARSARPYGSWPSPISAAGLATAAVRLGEVAAHTGLLCWLEGRATEGGRQVLGARRPDGSIEDLTAPDHNVRTLVHEYGGGAYCLTGEEAIYANFDDQRLWHQPLGGGTPVPLTAESPAPRSVRFADLTPAPDANGVFAVRERHLDGGEVVNDVVRVDLGDGSVTEVAGGDDFFSTPRPSPDGSTLAFLAWNHPNMPWDGTELRLITGSGTMVVAGGPDESVQQPTWLADGRLLCVSDRSGWWNIVEADRPGAPPVLGEEAEYGLPAWVFGQRTFLELDDGRLAAQRISGGQRGLVVISGGRAEPLETGLSSFGRLWRTSDGLLATVAASSTTPAAVVTIDPRSGQVTTVRPSQDRHLEPEWLSTAQPITYRTSGDAVSHALWYPPVHPDHEGTAEERPPLVVMSHGGPTAAADPSYDERVQFWTTRGIAVVDVDYRGSTGYGRHYRNQLRDKWGIADTDDCIAAARHLAEEGLVDPDRLAIRGGSAGGYTTLCALTFHDVFDAGCSLYGVADAEALARDTHKFESRYLDRLIGPYPEAADLYRERSPIHHTDLLSTPMLLLQGMEDAIVPPSQSEAMAAALAARGIPFAYIEFAGEQHGFRRAETIQHAAEAELSFYGRIFGFDPADDLPDLPIRNLPDDGPASGRPVQTP